MIKIRIAAVGKVKESYFREGIAEYAKRLSRYCEFEIAEVKEENFNDRPDDASIAKILKTEGERLSKAAKGYTIALAVEGRKLSSEKLARTIGNLTDSGEGEITFLIGGSYGIDEELKKRCLDRISFSDMTFPHALMRLIACEQIYRAFSILAGSEYHK